MTETIEVLKAARQLISDPAHWTQGEYARDANGGWTAFDGPDAVCFCAAGAISRVIDICDASDASEAEIQLEKTVGQGVVSFNDDHTHAEVLAAFDAAIARLA